MKIASKNMFLCGPAYVGVLRGVAITALVFLSGVPSTTFAREIEVGIDPPIIEMTSTPGEDIYGVVTVFAKSGDAVVLTVESFTPEGSLGYIHIDDEPMQSVEWVSYENEAFTISGEPNQIVSRQVGYVVSIPDDAAFGDYNLVLFAENRGSSKGVNSSQNTSNIAKIGANMLITVHPSDQQPMPQFSIESVNENVFVFGLPFVEQFEVVNKGPVRFPMNGTITVTDVWDVPVFETPLMPLNVLAGSVRRVQAVEDDGGEVRLTPHFRGKFGDVMPFFPNWFTTTVEVKASSGGEVVSAQHSTLYVPYGFMIVFAVLFSLLIFTHKVRKVMT